MALPPAIQFVLRQIRGAHLPFAGNSVVADRGSLARLTGDMEKAATYRKDSVSGPESHDPPATETSLTTSQSHVLRWAY